MKITKVASAAAVLAVAAGGLTLALGAGSPAQATSQQHPCVGSFRTDLTFVGPNATRPYLTTLNTERTGIISPPGASATVLDGAAAEVEFSSAGHGAWRPAGRNACLATFESLDANAEGRVTGSSRATVTLTVDGNRISLKGTATAFNAQGEELGAIPLTGTGRRIVVTP